MAEPNEVHEQNVKPEESVRAAEETPTESKQEEAKDEEGGSQNETHMDPPETSTNFINPSQSEEDGS